LQKIAMAKIKFKTQEGQIISTEGSKGSLMELARDNNVKGIDGDCGGVCSCATCHVHISAEDVDKFPAANEIEKDMLEFEDNTTEYSRLACQLEIKESLDGITLTVAN